MKFSAARRQTAPIVLAALLAAAVPATAQEPPQEALEPAPPAAEAAEPAPDPSLPGEHHEHLGALVGDWDFTMRIWETPGGEPTETRGTIEARWALGRRFVDAVYRGEILGRPFEGRRIDGYDNLEKKYQSIWQDNLATYTLFYRGECSQEGKVRSMTASFQHPTADVQLVNKGVTTLLEDGSFRYESFIVAPGGDEFKNMELEARRRAAPAG